MVPVVQLSNSALERHKVERAAKQALRQQGIVFCSAHHQQTSHAMAPLWGGVL